MSTHRVFVTQPHMTRDDQTGARRPKFDLTPALHFGRLVFMLEDSQIAATMPEEAITEIDRQLDEHAYSADTDYLLATGDMTLGMFAYYAMMRRGGCRVLRWDGKYRRYDVIITEGVENERGRITG